MSDHFSRFVVLVGNSLPDFWFALVLILIFFGLLDWAPPPIGRIESDIGLELFTGFLTLTAYTTLYYTLAYYVSVLLGTARFVRSSVLLANKLPGNI